MRYPETRKGDVVDEYGSVRVADPYRWLEDLDSPEVAAWVAAQNAVTQTSVDDIALNREIVTSIDHSFSTTLDDWSVTHQKRSGRCWMFAGLNLCRPGAMARMNLKAFEFSQNYLLFWDKLEKANYFLEAILETADRPADERTVHWLLGNLLSDGGQWNMFVNLIHKYGVVPKSAMPETESSSNTGSMNAILKVKLREGARTLRQAIAEREHRREMERELGRRR